ncbi:NHLP leader peptide family RiPP precursor [Longimicrobium sp.]|uniref:NHLP leader peptide family RiPP precursor n=1 Tax=Longimicrobium sp. TaxID=2029185 RepID=UPI002E35FEA9|nr:NHLP leader peptide family RiPP precursor [Longimicrobium sp.]HEX6042086.1 NHLP leader peptide family RiPP precursor [Longimicrobium sp.]
MNKPLDQAGLPFEAPLWTAQLAPGGSLMVRTRARLEHEVIIRALRDAAFRHELVANPKPLIEAELGYELPDTLEIEVLEESAVVRYLVIPHNLVADHHQGRLNLHQAADWVMDGRRMPLLDVAQASDLLIQAWTDEGFRAQILSEPKVVLQHLYGVEVEPGAVLQARFETAERLYIVIPDLFGYNELDDSELAEFVSYVNEPMVIGSPALCTVKTTESPYGCGPH